MHTNIQTYTESHIYTAPPPLPDVTHKHTHPHNCLFFLFLGVYGTGICDSIRARSGGECAEAARRADAAAAAAVGRRVRRGAGRCVWCAGGAGRCVWCGPAGSAGRRAAGGVRALGAPLPTPAAAPLASLSA